MSVLRFRQPPTHAVILTMRCAFLVLLAAVLSASGCDDFSAYCEEYVDCIDGNDADVEACEINTGAAADRASLYGCSDYFDSYQACLQEESKCEGSDNFTTEGRCDDESNEYSSCMSDSLPI